jgi:hypothetical protein
MEVVKRDLVVAREFKFGSIYVTQVKICGKVNMSECKSTDL